MNFSFNGGVRCGMPASEEKFLLFVVDGKNELPIYTALQMGLVVEKTRGHYESKIEHVKVQCYLRNSLSKLNHSFVFRLDPDGGDIELKGLGLGAHGFLFRCKGHLVPKSEASQLLSGVSRKFMERQTVLPKMMKDKMLKITYKEGDNTEYVRKIRIRKG